MNRLLALVLVVLGALPVNAEVWHLGNFEVRWADGWTRESTSEVIRFVAPTGRSGVTIDLLDQEAPRENGVGYAKQTLPLLASRHGKVVEGLKEESLPSGATLFSIVFCDSDKDYFGIMFVHISAKGRLAQMAIEGFGDPKPLVSDYREFAHSVLWKTEPNQSPEPTVMSVTPRADARGVPATTVAHL